MRPSGCHEPPTGLASAGFAAAGKASSVSTGGRPVIEFRGVTKRYPDGTVAVDDPEDPVGDRDRAVGVR
jgi:hypothetical protein